MTDAPAIAALASRALIRLDGPDWRSFLDNLISQGVETLAAGEARFGALLTPQGRLLFDLFVIGREDGAWLDVQADRRATLIQRRIMYRLRAKVEIEADGAPILAALGPMAGPGWVADPRRPELGARGYGVSLGPTVGEDAYDAWRLSHGVPDAADWGSDRTYPIEADFDLLQGIDFQKGCFVGQETTSRMKRRGQIKNRMMPIDFDGPAPAFGTEVLAGELRAGEVLTGRDGRAMALLRLDRIGGALTADGRAVSVDWPAWMPQA